MIKVTREQSKPKKATHTSTCLTDQNVFEKGRAIEGTNIQDSGTEAAVVAAAVAAAARLTDADLVRWL